MVTNPGEPFQVTVQAFRSRVVSTPGPQADARWLWPDWSDLADDLQSGYDGVQENRSMSSTMTLPVTSTEFDSVPPAEIAGSLFRQTARSKKIAAQSWSPMAGGEFQSTGSST